MEALLLEHVPAPLLAIGMIGFAVAVSVAGLAALRRRVGPQALIENREVAGYVFAVVGAVYAVLLAFAVVLVWEQFEDARSAATEEAAAVEVLHRDAQVFATRGTAAQESVQRYAAAVAGPEWKAMEDDQEESPEADAATEALWAEFDALEPSGPAEEVVFDKAIDQLDELTALRRERLLASRAHVPGGLWLVLIGGAVICVGFAYLIGVTSFRIHALLVGTLAGTIALLLFLMLSIDLPYSGDISVKPEAMEEVVAEIRND